MPKAARKEQAEHTRVLKELELIAQLMGSGIEIDDVQAVAKGIHKTEIGDDLITLVKKKIRSAENVQQAVSDSLAGLGLEEFVGNNNSFRLILSEKQKQHLAQEKKMAKTTGQEPNKSQIIRDALDRLGDVSPAKVAEYVKDEHDIEVAPGFISTIKTKWKKASKTKPATAKVATLFPNEIVAAPAKPTPATPNPDGADIDTMKAAFRLALKAGSVAKAIEVLKSIE